MKKLFYFISIILLFSTYANGYAEDNEHLLLWSATKGESQIYLLGSIHTATKEMYPLDSQIEQSFKKCQYLVLETLPDSIDMMEMLSIVSYADGSTLKDHISEESYKTIQTLAQKHDIGQQYFDMLKPWYAIMMLTILEMGDVGIKPEYGIDTYFQKKAKETDKTICQLETPTEQLRYLSLMDGVSDDYIQFNISEMTTSIEEINEMVKAWKNGDGESLIAKINQQEKEYPEIKKINEKIIGERNKNMAKRIDTMLKKQGDYFIIVGAGHLLGEGSVIEILSKQGYEFTRMKKQ